MAYSQDIALLTDSNEDMRKIMLQQSNQAMTVGLQFNEKETKLMSVGQRISTDDICINGEAIEIVNDFCELRCFVADDCNDEKEIDRDLTK